jgi:hypothetical protein
LKHLVKSPGGRKFDRLVAVEIAADIREWQELTRAIGIAGACAAPKSKASSMPPGRPPKRRRRRAWPTYAYPDAEMLAAKP